MAPEPRSPETHVVEFRKATVVDPITGTGTLPDTLDVSGTFPIVDTTTPNTYYLSCDASSADSYQVSIPDKNYDPKDKCRGFRKFINSKRRR